MACAPRRRATRGNESNSRQTSSGRFRWSTTRSWGLEPSFTCGDFFFVHAGVRWMREDFLLHEER